MSETTTRNALLSALIGGTDYPIAFENSHPPFDPEPHELWLAQYYLPTSGDSRGKGSNSSQERGIYQVSIFIKASTVCGVGSNISIYLFCVLDSNCSLLFLSI